MVGNRQKTATPTRRFGVKANRQSQSFEENYMKFSAVLATTLLAALCSVGSADGPSPADRRVAEQNGWIYDDFEYGIQEADRTGKPLLIVLRCPP